MKAELFFECETMPGEQVYVTFFPFGDAQKEMLRAVAEALAADKRFAKVRIEEEEEEERTPNVTWF